MAQPSIALLIVDTDHHVLAAQALRISLPALPFKEVLIFSDRPDAWGGHPVITIPTLRSIEEYHRLITRDVVEHVHSDFVLIIQYDGFVLNADQFSPHFFFYDYIGAPWPQFTEHEVGNGGFCWRSRKLMEAVAKLDYDDLRENEDLFICRRMRPTLEAQGLRFAPKPIAQHFSVEFPAVPWPTFGFHGIFLLPQVYRQAPDFLLEHLNDRVIKSRSQYLLPGLEAVSPAHAQRLRDRRDRLLQTAAAG